MNIYQYLYNVSSLFTFTSDSSFALYYKYSSSDNFYYFIEYPNFGEVLTLSPGWKLFSNIPLNNSNLELISHGVNTVDGNCQFYTSNTSLSAYKCYNSSLSITPIQEGNNNIITTEQVQNVGTALIQGGGSVLHIGLQLLPYLIFITIIFIIFLIIKRFSVLNPK